MIEVGMMVTHDSQYSDVNEARTERFGPVGLVVSVSPSYYSLQSTLIKVLWCKEETARKITTRAVRVISK